MRRTVLGKSGLEVSAVGFGAIPIQRVSEMDAVAALHRAFELGVNFIDTADSYGDSQRKIGKAIANRRDGLVLASKGGASTREGIIGQIDNSLAEMGVEHIDLYQFHNIGTAQKWDEISAPGGAMEGMFAARDAGKIGHIGFTTHSLDMALSLIDEDVFETVQFPFNLVLSEAADDLIPLARESGLGYIVMKPLCGGMYHDAELAFRFLNSFPDLVPIPGIEKTVEIEQIAAITADGGMLDGEQQDRALEMAAELGKQFCRRCGYCMPCLHGVPIILSMVLDSFIVRFPREKLIAGPAGAVALGAGKCVRCGKCEQLCPYSLPIMDTVAESHRKAVDIVEGISGNHTLQQ